MRRYFELKKALGYEDLKKRGTKNKNETNKKNGVGNWKREIRYVIR